MLSFSVIARTILPFGTMLPIMEDLFAWSKSGRTPLELDALLLFALPLLLTLAKLEAELMSRSHQFARSRIALCFVQESESLDNGQNVVHDVCDFSYNRIRVFLTGLQKTIVRLTDALIQRHLLIDRL